MSVRLLALMIIAPPPSRTVPAFAQPTIGRLASAQVVSPHANVVDTIGPQAQVAIAVQERLCATVVLQSVYLNDKVRPRTVEVHALLNLASQFSTMSLIRAPGRM